MLTTQWALQSDRAAERVHRLKTSSCDAAADDEQRVPRHTGDVPSPFANAPQLGTAGLQPHARANAPPLAHADDGDATEADARQSRCAQGRPRMYLSRPRGSRAMRGAVRLRDEAEDVEDDVDDV